MPNLFKRIKKAIKTLGQLLLKPDEMTYFPDEPRKSKLQIWADHILWLIKYHRINHYYYVYGFDRKVGVNREDYLSEKEFCLLRNRANVSVFFGDRKANYICVLRDKFVFSQYLKSINVPAPATLALCDGESIRWLESRHREPLAALAKRDGLDVFIKELVGECGDGVYPVRVEQGQLFINGSPASIDDLANKLNGFYIVQERINQHSRMQELNPSSVNTIRVITARDIKNNQIEVIGSVLRVGSGGSHCDNWAAGGVIVGIDEETGKLNTPGVFKPGKGKMAYSHPMTGVEFVGFGVPFYEETKELVKKMHQFFYGVHSIGWDIAITEDGPMVIEGNDSWDTQLMQVHDNKIAEKFLKTTGK